jgi:hypothetical protein
MLRGQGKGGRLTSDPNRSSLGLLPSGPDPVGEWSVHCQPPGFYIGRTKRESKRAPGEKPKPFTARVPARTEIFDFGGFFRPTGAGQSSATAQTERTGDFLRLLFAPRTVNKN